MPREVGLYGNVFTIGYRCFPAGPAGPADESVFPRDNETLSFFLLSSLRGRQLLSCLALRPQIGPNALPLTNQNPTTKAKGYILLKKGKRKSKKHYPSYIKE